MRDGGAGGSRALTAYHLGAAGSGVMHDDRHIAAGTVQMRFDHLQRKCSGDTGVECIAALLKSGHPDRGRNPVGRGDDPEGAFDFWPRGEGIGIDIAHCYPWFGLGGT